MLLDEAAPIPPALKTWDAFLEGTSPSHEPLFVTEAGPTAFDAILCWPTDPLELQNVEVPVVEAKAYLTSLLAMAVGRESTFFARNEHEPYFKSTLPTMRISGYSRHSLQGLEGECLQSGRIFLELQTFVRTEYSRHTSKSGVALASTVERVLQILQQHVFVDGASPGSLLQLQSIVKRMLAILRPCRKLTEQLTHEHTDEDVLAVVFDETMSVYHFDHNSEQMLQEILQRVSRPWMEFIEEWLGIRPEEGRGLAKKDSGTSKAFVKVEAEYYINDSGQEVEDVDFRLNADKLPHFMPRDVAEAIFDTGRNLRLIRSAHPDNPLAQSDLIASSHPPAIEWAYTWKAIDDLERQVMRYHDGMADAIRRSQAGLKAPIKSNKFSYLTNPDVHLCFGVDQGQIEDNIATSIKQLDTPVKNAQESDRLSSILLRQLCSSSHPRIDQAGESPHGSLLPILSFSGIASAQSKLVNRECMRLLFKSHNLREHLQVQRDFHLLGNGLFCSRLSQALFNPDLESTERQAGVARQGGVMGLRLGGRDMWPPASSELRLALMGVLAEAYSPRTGRSIGKQTNSNVPGDLSFSVRDLSSEEIDRCMNTDSLEALDFLRLSYTTPESLAPIITPVILMQYDRIFRLLLRVLRMIYIVNQLFRDLNDRHSQWQDPNTASYRFVIEGHHFVSSVAAYFLDTGVDVPWRAFERRLDKIEADLDSPGEDGSPERLQSPGQLLGLHSSVIDQIVLSLFLRKRQKPILGILENIFNLILRFAKYSRLRALGEDVERVGEDEQTALYRDFRKEVQLFITVCRGLTEKSRHVSRKGVEEDSLGMEDGLGEESAVAQLLMRLDMFDYYSKR